MVVFKYELAPSTLVSIPRGFKPLSVAFQGDILCMWALVNPHNEKVKVRFNAYPTGSPFDDNLSHKFIGTVFKDWLVFHVFQVGE